MSFSVRDGRFDVALVAGPRVTPWPSVGVRAISTLCAEMGLTVGYLGGGDGLLARGVLPLPGTGGLVLAQDVQQRIHRIQARAVVKLSVPSSLPDPFPGWRSQGLIPIETAWILHSAGTISWNPGTVILGTGNAALRLGSQLIEDEVKQVICIETRPFEWGAKRFAGWEVERRRFEMLGGKIIEGQPVRLSQKGPLLWELKVQDEKGIRIIDIGRVVAAGPFTDSLGVREYPPGSFLFELEQTSRNSIEEDVEGWVVEEDRARLLAVKIVRALTTELGASRREHLDKIQRRARTGLKRQYRHREEPFTPSYQGKWILAGDARKIRSFSGVPQKTHQNRMIASIECFEEIGCNLCEKACPEGAISFSKKRAQILDEDKCTACGICLPACPSNATQMLLENETHATSKLTLTWRLGKSGKLGKPGNLEKTVNGRKPWKPGELATLVNRRGENLGSARVSEVSHPVPGAVQLVQVEVATHLLWEARGLKRVKTPAQEAEEALPEASLEEKVEITFNGEKRLVRDRAILSLALFEVGQARPEDVLACPDGSCGLCQVDVDGMKKLACQTQVRRGMAVKLLNSKDTKSSVEEPLCPCMGVSGERVTSLLNASQLQSPEAVISMTSVGQGGCHGQLCTDSLRRLLIRQGMKAEHWIDWRFPWTEWVLVPGGRD